MNGKNSRGSIPVTGGLGVLPGLKSGQKRRDERMQNPRRGFGLITYYARTNAAGEVPCRYNYPNNSWDLLLAMTNCLSLLKCVAGPVCHHRIDDRLEEQFGG